MQGTIKTVLPLLLIGLAGVSHAAEKANIKKGVHRMDTITVSSRVFAARQPIPAQYTCDGADISPPLDFGNFPAGAKSIVLVSDDPDAPGGTWVHWVVYDLPPRCASLAQAVPKTDTIAGGGVQGKNDFGRIGYNGPCPPGGTHRYFFKVYALDTMLNLPAGKTKKEIEKAMKGRVIAMGELVGTYKRNR